MRDDRNVCPSCESLNTLDTERCKAVGCGARLQRPAAGAISIWLREDPDPELLLPLKRTIRSTFGVPVVVQPSFLYDAPAARKGTRSLSATAFLNQAQARVGDAAACLCITERNIKPLAGHYNFIFGYSYMRQGSAAMSLYQLRESGRARAALVLERAKKIAIHELGHAFGLDHCEGDARCVMSSAGDEGTVADVDAESTRFCKACAGLIGLA